MRQDFVTGTTFVFFILFITFINGEKFRESMHTEQDSKRNESALSNKQIPKAQVHGGKGITLTKISDTSEGKISKANRNSQTNKHHGSQVSASVENEDPQTINDLTTKVQSAGEHHNSNNVLTTESQSTGEHHNSNHVLTTESQSTVEHHNSNHVLTTESQSTVEHQNSNHVLTTESQSAVEHHNSINVLTTESQSTVEHHNSNHVLTTESKSAVEHHNSNHVLTTESKSAVEHHNSNHVLTTESQSAGENENSRTTAQQGNGNNAGPISKTLTPDLGGREVTISSVVFLKGHFSKGLRDKTSSSFYKYRNAFDQALNKFYQDLPGFISVVNITFSNGSILTGYGVKVKASVVNDKFDDVKKGFLEKNTNKQLQILHTYLNGTDVKEEIEYLKTINNNNKTLLTEINEIPNTIAKWDHGICNPGQVFVNKTCRIICLKDYCGSHGTCLMNSTTRTAQCACEALYTGPHCEQKNDAVFPSKERLLIIEIAGGAGGGALLFLIIVLVCVCIRWRKNSAKDTNSDEKTYLNDKKALGMEELSGKTNPVYEKDLESNVAEGIPSRRGSLERRSPPYGPLDGGFGQRTDYFGKTHDYDRTNSERNFIRRDDGRVYHVIDDGEPSNQTLLYQPSRYQQSNGSVTHEHDQPRYTDYPRTHSVYDHIDTSREYKIARPNFGGRSRNYDY